MALAASVARRFNRAEYQRMADSGIFTGERVELLDGVVVSRSRQSSRHAAVVHRLWRALSLALGHAYAVRSQAPVVLGTTSEPEPDVAVCRADPDDYVAAHPTAADLSLVVEVADSSLSYDRGQKGSAYASAGVPTYWLVNLVSGRLEVFTEPDTTAGRYVRHQVVADQAILPNGRTLKLAEILPPR
jgi:Uma2 family endonuclease